MNRKGSEHSTMRNNHDFCLVVVKFDFVVSHTFLYIIGAKPHRVSEARRAIGSGKVVELVIVSI